MFSKINFEIGILATGVGLFAAINALFFKADDFFSKEFREDVALRILCLNPIERGKNAWSTYFVRLFDKVFLNSEIDNCNFKIKNYLSVRTFLKSSLVSIFSIFMISMIGITIGPKNIEGFFQAFRYNLVIFALFAIGLNLIPDYISLLETRLLINLIEKHKVPLKINQTNQKKRFGWIYWLKKVLQSRFDILLSKTELTVQNLSSPSFIIFGVYLKNSDRLSLKKVQEI